MSTSPSSNSGQPTVEGSSMADYVEMDEMRRDDSHDLDVW